VKYFSLTKHGALVGDEQHFCYNENFVILRFYCIVIDLLKNKVCCTVLYCLNSYSNVAINILYQILIMNMNSEVVKRCTLEWESVTVQLISVLFIYRQKFTHIMSKHSLQSLVHVFDLPDWGLFILCHKGSEQNTCLWVQVCRTSYLTVVSFNLIKIFISWVCHCVFRYWLAFKQLRTNSLHFQWCCMIH
jgi:hypothetical protein